MPDTTSYSYDTFIVFGLHIFSEKKKNKYSWALSDNIPSAVHYYGMHYTFCRCRDRPRFHINVYLVPRASISIAFVRLVRIFHG